MRVPAAAQQRELQPLRRSLAQDPTNVSAALELSRAYLDLGRREGDPRFISYAQATLAPFTQGERAFTDALVLTAIALQSLHRFDDSMTFLSRAITSEPRHAQAWLTRATVQQVRGDFDAARDSCAHLIGITDTTVALACAASVNGMTGRLQQSYAALSAFARNSNSDARVQSWIGGQLGEMAVRLGDDTAAERHFRASLNADPGDVQVKAELADLLLRQRRWEATIDLLSGLEAQDTLLLRLAIAGQRLDQPHWAELYEARYQAALLDGDVTHVREHARYLLEVRGDRKQAFTLAQRNWQVQREPADIRLYWLASSDATRTTIAQWIAHTRYEDATLPLGVRTSL
ncbi:MAG: tetratricopeptide repeat protein [Povalibacter sp.]